MRKDRWGKLTNNQETRWVGSRQIDMRAHKTKTKPCAYTKQKHKHMASKTKSLAMCKTGHKHGANKNTHKPRVHLRHDNMTARSPLKTQAACHTAQDIT